MHSNATIRVPQDPPYRIIEWVLLEEQVRSAIPIMGQSGADRHVPRPIPNRLNRWRKSLPGGNRVAANMLHFSLSGQQEERLYKGARPFPGSKEHAIARAGS